MALTINNPDLIFSPIMTFKEYYIKSTNLKNINFSDGWGWFVDIETTFPGTNQLFNKYIKKTSDRINTPGKITEMRSFKSMNNLHDDEPIILNKNKNKNKNKFEDLIKWNKYKQIKIYIIHSICILGIIELFYIINF